MSNRRKVKRGKPKPVRPQRVERVKASELKPGRQGPVTAEHREGVWVHSFKCGACKLEFQVFSWLPNRHRVDPDDGVYCPECGEQTPMLHFRSIVSESPTLVLGAPNEVYRLFNLPGSEFMDDSAYVDDDGEVRRVKPSPPELPL